MPPTPQPTTPSPLIIVVCESVPTSVSGSRTPSRSATTSARYSQVDLVHDAGSRGHDAEVGKGLLRPPQERIPLPVALVLALDVDQERRIGAVLVDLDRVIDDEIGGHERVDPGGIAAHLRHGIAHRGEVDNAGNAGEVLEDHARRHERQLRLAGLGRIPRGKRADVIGGHEVRVRRRSAQHVLEQHLHGVGQACQVGGAGRVEGVIRVARAVDVERSSGAGMVG